jgi:hypothetical protein
VAPRSGRNCGVPEGAVTSGGRSRKTGRPGSVARAKVGDRGVHRDLRALYWPFGEE